MITTIKNIKQILIAILLITVLIIGGIVLWYQSKGVSHLQDEPVFPTPAQRTVTKVEGVDAIDDLTDIVYNASLGLFYVSSFDEGIVYVVSEKSKRIDGQIKVDFPHKLYFDELTQILYVSAGDNRLIKVRVDTFAEVSRAQVSRKPSGMALDRSRGYVYVATEFGNTVDVVDVATMIVVRSIPVGSGPTDVAMGRDGSFVYVVEREDASIGIISTETLQYVKSISFTGRPHRIFSTDESDVLFILDQYTNSLVLFNQSTQTVARSIPIVPFPSDLTIDMSRRKLYISSFSDNTVAVVDFDSERVEQILSIAQSSFTLTAGLNNIYMVPGSNEVLVSNTNTGELHFVMIR